jgi:hypothetical protein
MDHPPTLAEVGTRLEGLEYRSGTILFLSAVNLMANVLTIIVAFLVAA